MRRKGYKEKGRDEWVTDTKEVITNLSTSVSKREKETKIERSGRASS